MIVDLRFFFGTWLFHITFRITQRIPYAYIWLNHSSLCFAFLAKDSLNNSFLISYIGMGSTYSLVFCGFKIHHHSPFKLWCTENIWQHPQRKNALARCAWWNVIWSSGFDQQVCFENSRYCNPSPVFLSLVFSAVLFMFTFVLVSPIFILIHFLSVIGFLSMSQKSDWGQMELQRFFQFSLC